MYCFKLKGNSPRNMSSKLGRVSCTIVSYCNTYLSSLDTLLVGNDAEVGNAEQGQLATSTGIFVVPKTVTPKDTLLDRSYIAKKSKAEKGLKEVYEYLTEKRSKVVAARMILREQERGRASKKRLGAAKKRAMGARKKMDIATRDSDIANLDLAMVIDEVKNEEEQIQSSKKHQLCQATEDGFRKFQVKVLEMELSSDGSD